MLIWTKKKGGNKMLELYLSLIFDSNDNDLFEEIYCKYENYVLKVAKYYVKDYHYAQDASQIAFKNIAIYIDKIKPLSKDLLKVYIYRIARHASYLVINKNLKNRFNIEYTDNPSNEDLIDEYIDLDKLARIKRHIQNMDIKYKNILSLYFQDDMNFREIAEILHIPKSTANARFNKAMEILKEKFKEEDYD